LIHQGKSIFLLQTVMKIRRFISYNEPTEAAFGRSQVKAGPTGTSGVFYHVDPSRDIVQQGIFRREAGYFRASEVILVEPAA
jgi:hypothetical protein